MIHGMKKKGRKDALTRSEALVREAQIKAMPRSKKEGIIFHEAGKD